MDWVVAYGIEPHVAVEGSPPDMPELGLAFEYDAEGKLSGVQHALSVEAGADVIRRSRAALTVFWDLLSYGYGSRVKVTGADARPLDPNLGDRARLIVAKLPEFDVSGLLSKPVKIPTAGKIGADARTGTWLRFAVIAQSETNPAHALRDYFMILEDMIGRNHPTIIDIKHIRDFVSHGDKLTNPDLLALVERELGHKADRFEPANREHQAMVRRYLDRARKAVNGELSTRLA